MSELKVCSHYCFISGQGRLKCRPEPAATEGDDLWSTQLQQPFRPARAPKAAPFAAAKRQPRVRRWNDNIVNGDNSHVETGRQVASSSRVPGEDTCCERKGTVVYPESCFMVVGNGDESEDRLEHRLLKQTGVC